MRKQFVSSMLEMCVLHTQPLVSQPTLMTQADHTRVTTLQVTTSPADAVVVHDIVMASSSRCDELDVVYFAESEDHAARLYWNERAGRYLPVKPRIL